VTGERVTAGQLVSRSGRCYPITNSVARFVPPSTYADSFGLQWRIFSKTQLDSNSGQPISAQRFYRFTRWKPQDLAGKLVLDVGCGAGRFAEIALSAGATVVAVDYSAAVDACWENLSRNDKLTVIQADIYSLPFEKGCFDLVYCLGVLQHTPDVREAFMALPAQLKTGGALAVDLYPKLLRNLFWSKYWVRPITKRLKSDRLFEIVRRWAPRMLRMSDLIRHIPLIGRFLRYGVPVANYAGVYPLTKKQIEEWAILDTFDMLAPKFDKPQRKSTLRRWFVEAGLNRVSVERIGFLVGRGIK